MMKKLLLFIATKKGCTALRHLIKNGRQKNIGIVVTFREVNVDKDWSYDIEETCIKNHIPCFLWTQIKTNIIGLITKYQITGAVAIAWRYLIPLKINEYLEDDLIVFHDSLLPQYRGFAPTPTAIICGEEKVGVTALFATETVDQGEIILQRHLLVSSDMYMNEIIEEQSHLYACMLEAIITQMEENILSSYPQDESKATYSIWRNPEDCHINWNRPAREVYNFIRALGTPYPGAFSFLNTKKIKINRAIVLDYDLNFSIREAGKIWKLVDQNPDVICGEGMLRILDASTEDGAEFQFKKIRCRLV